MASSPSSSASGYAAPQLGSDRDLGLAVGDGHEVAGVRLGGDVAGRQLTEARVHDLVGDVLEQGEYVVGLHAGQPTDRGRCGRPQAARASGEQTSSTLSLARCTGRSVIPARPATCASPRAQARPSSPMRAPTGTGQQEGHAGVTEDAVAQQVDHPVEIPLTGGGRQLVDLHDRARPVVVVDHEDPQHPLGEPERPHEAAPEELEVGLGPDRRVVRRRGDGRDVVVRVVVHATRVCLRRGAGNRCPQEEFRAGMLGPCSSASTR